MHSSKGHLVHKEEGMGHDPTPDDVDRTVSLYRGPQLISSNMLPDILYSYKYEIPEIHLKMVLVIVEASVV